ncbi:hypothetical protein D9615_006848 [Tricholomella constricta]|uniref:Uncharacterized protein n=1 Tax=Tricholomella constricta TaxID=117010 RepID=A0A8H5M337_9AGAR|nr:hypothetical protein D9615_006848 [Tricholomella constricta]
MVRRSKERPSGALAAAVQACTHNLNMCTTGMFVKPPGRLSHFRTENCDDRDHITIGNAVIPIKATSHLMKAIKNLDDFQWQKITQCAIETLATKSTKPTIDVLDPAAPSSDIEMIDDDDEYQAQYADSSPNQSSSQHGPGATDSL